MSFEKKISLTLFTFNLTSQVYFDVVLSLHSSKLSNWIFLCFELVILTRHSTDINLVFLVLLQKMMQKRRERFTSIFFISSCCLPAHTSAHCLKNYKIYLEKKSPKNRATADKIDSWSLKFGLTSLWKRIPKIGATADKINSWSPKFGVTAL